jgi:hypothetical protein
MKNFTWPLLLLTAFSLIQFNCAKECQDCPEPSSEKIIVDEVDTALVKKADNIIVDEVDTAYIKNAKYIIIENAENAYFENSKMVVFSGKSGFIIVDEVDTAIVVDPQPDNPLRKIVDQVRRAYDDDENEEDEDEKRQ